DVGGHAVVGVGEGGVAELGEAVGLVVVVDQPPVGDELLGPAQALVVGGRVPAGDLLVQAHGPAGDHAVDAPLGQGGERPREVVVQGDDGHVGGGVGEVDRVAPPVADDHLEGGELPAEERPD